MENFSVKYIVDQYSFLMREISKTYVADTIRLDFLLHTLLGQIIYIILRKFGAKPIASYIIVVVIALSKEIVDSFSLTNELVENITDFSLTMLLPTLSFLIDKKINKKKLN